MGLVPSVRPELSGELTYGDTLEKMSQFIRRAATCALKEKQTINVDGPSPGRLGFTRVKTTAPNLLLKHDTILKVGLDAGWNVSPKRENNSPVLQMPSLFPFGLAVDTFG